MNMFLKDMGDLLNHVGLYDGTEGSFNFSDSIHPATLG